MLITAHDAFGYFGEQYGIEVRGLQGTSTATEASADDVQALAELIVERQVKAIFVESSVPLATIEAVQAACKAVGLDVAIGGQLFSDAMGAVGHAGRNLHRHGPAQHRRDRPAHSADDDHAARPREQQFTYDNDATI